jgi:hypothetical protein
MPLHQKLHNLFHYFTAYHCTLRQPKFQTHLPGRHFHKSSLYAFNRCIKYFTFHTRNYDSPTSNELFRNSCCLWTVIQNCIQTIESHRNNCVQCSHEWLDPLQSDAKVAQCHVIGKSIMFLNSRDIIR